MQNALLAEGLRKGFGEVNALDGFDLEVGPGTIHGLLGPNGAGKSTAVGVLSTLVAADGGRAFVAGHDVCAEPGLVRRRIGLVGQAAALDEVLSGRENLVMFGRLFGRDRRSAESRADELLEAMNLAAAATRPASSYSGGMRRRLDIAASLVETPAVLFLDEPTTGLDPRARNDVWQTVRQIVELGTTVLLTTQYLDEADQLADRVTVMNEGRVVAADTPDRLKQRIGRGRVVVRLGDDEALQQARVLLECALAEPPALDSERRSLTVEAAAGSTILLEVARELDAAGIEPIDIGLRQPTLDEVFLTLTEPAARPAPEAVIA